jgi:hypothetical protein
MEMVSTEWIVRTKRLYRTWRAVSAVLPGSIFSLTCRYFLGLFLALVLLSGCTAQTLPGSRFIKTVPAFSSLPALPPPRLTIAVDPRLELLAVIQSLSGYDERTGLITDLDFPYKEKVEQWFASYRKHTAVTRFDEMSQSQFSFDGPPHAMLFLSPPPGLGEETPLSDDVLERAGGRSKLEAFIEAMRDFADDSDFMQFYSENTPFYQDLIADVEAMVHAEDLTLLREYYGMHQHSYNILLVPMFHAGGFGSRVERGDGQFDVYSINGPHAVNGELLSFGSPEE